MTSDIDVLIASSRAILLDFDGPVCNLFARHPASRVAEKLRINLLGRGAQLPSSLASAPNPLRLHRWTGENRPDLMAEIDEMLTAEEMIAAASAVPTASAHEIIRLSCSSGRSVAIVSNNSMRAIARYLAAHELTSYVSTLACRVDGRPDLMKPNPDSVLRATKSLKVPPESCILIGDAMTDMEAARKAGAARIGYAKRPERISGLTDAGADVVLTSLMPIARALRKSQ
ncbi:HAD family hydrolase [Nonomuraea dietziae]|uniref:HAD family hydrolase n=1 Tax=Nonomuraea dietziae TaxID=65515 RepID=UPI00341529F6